MRDITSRDNQWVKLACSLKNKKGRQAHRRVFVEGFRLIEDAAAHGLRHVVCFVDAQGQQRNGFVELYRLGQELEWQFFSVTDSVYDKLKDTQNPQGIAAMLPFFEYQLEAIADQLSPWKTVLFLQSIQDPGNLGTIIRTAAAANGAAILLSEDSVDLYNDKTLRSAMGAVFKIPVVQHVTQEELLQFCHDRGRLLLGTTPHGTASYAELTYAQPCVLAFGNEGNGLSESFLNSCDGLLTIPMRRDTESLNLSMAVGVVLYKAWEMQGFRE